MAMYMSTSSFKPCLHIYRENETLLLFSNGATCRPVVAGANPSLIFRATELNIRKRRDLRFPTVGHNIRIRWGIIFFRRKQRQNRQRDLQSILMRSLLFFASKQNFFIDILVNNWSEYAKVVLNADSDGGQGGGFTFLPGLGGSGDENYHGRKSSEKWWWGFLSTTAILGLVLFIGIYSGILKVNDSSLKRLKELATQAGSHGLLLLLLLLIVVSGAFTGSIFVGFVRSLIKNSKATLFPPRRTHKAKSLTVRALLWAAGIGMLYPIFPRAEGFLNYLRQSQQTMDDRIRAVWMVLYIRFMRIHSLCQNKVEELINSVATREAKPRNRRKGRAS